MLVAIYHLYPLADVPSWVRPVVARGYLSVDLFFILSGFVIALNYAPGLARAGKADFLLRRLARLYPLYIAILAARVGWSLLAHGSLHVAGASFVLNLPHPARDLAANLAMVQSWGIATAITNPTWSVSTEWGAYLLFPALAALALRGPAWRWVALAAAALALVGLVALLDHLDGGQHNGALDAYDGRLPAPLLRCLAGFALGTATWRATRVPVIARAASHPAVAALVVLWLAGGLYAGLPDLALYPAFPALVLCLACGRRGVARALAAAPVVLLGDWSYAIYLLHTLLQSPLAALRARLHASLPPAFAEAVAFLLLMVVLLSLAALAHRLIEQPGRRAIRAAGKRWLRPARDAGGGAGAGSPRHGKSA